ncbi:MAG: transglycosylase SLT domain-containing protein [Anaerolineae bacterium]|nr:transglycosylase SLT domain-containing protein [Anaerolineae bacterium]
MADDQPQDAVGNLALCDSCNRALVKPGQKYRWRRKLSAQNKWMLTVACLLALSVLVIVSGVDSFTPTRIAGQKSVVADLAPEITVDVEITYEKMFQEIAPQYGLDWKLLARQAHRESRFDPLAVGKANEAGLMQIIPSTWNEWAPKLGVADPYDPYSNVLVAAAYLAYLREYFAKMGYPEERWMLVAYNWGPHNLGQLLESGGEWEQIPEKQRRYVLDILNSASDTPPGWEKIRDRPVARITP